MTESLRPMNLGGILDRGVQVFRSRPTVFVALASITGVAQLAYKLASVRPKPAVDGDSANGGLVFASYAASFVTWLAVAYFGPIMRAANCLAASRINLGEGVTIREAFGTFAPKFWRLFGLGLLQAIFAGWPFIIAGIFWVVIAAAAPSSRSDFSIVAAIFILAGIPSLALYTRYALAYPAIAIEGVTAQQAIDRSVRLTEGGRWRIFWGLVVPLVPSLLLTVGVLGLMVVLMNGRALLASNPLLVAAVNGAVGLISALLFAPYASIVLTLLYYDQRMRREGFDVERMMQAAGLDASPALAGGVNEATTPQGL
jgi:hypothetical protein